MDGVNQGIHIDEQAAEAVSDPSRIDLWNIGMPLNLHFMPEKTRLYQKSSDQV